MNNISEAQRDDYKKVLQYRALAKHTGNAWKNAFSYKDSGQQIPQALLNRALKLSSLRDAIAHQIVNKAQYSPYISQENISDEKLLTHAKGHQLKLRELKEIQEIRRGLLLSLEKNEHSFTNEESKKWHRKWRDLTRHVGQIEWSKTGYLQALKAYPLATQTIPDKHISLLRKYDLSHNNSADYLPNKWEPNKSPRYDLNLTIERLMSNPEQSYKAIFGEPKSTKGNEMRFSGGLIVTLTSSPP